ncbi:unnamed protein product, partial [Meganyctiphanes norvegica]
LGSFTLPRLEAATVHVLIKGPQCPLILYSPKYDNPRVSGIRSICSGSFIILGCSVAVGFFFTRLFTRSPEAWRSPPLRRNVPQVESMVIQPDNAVKSSLMMTNNQDSDGKHIDTKPSVNEIEENLFDKAEDTAELTFDMSRQYVRMWPDDKGHCGRIETRFGVNTSWAWLISYPRSGNTWTRYLLEASTGVFSGSVYGSELLKELQYLGEKENPYHNTTCVVKTHTLPNRDYKRKRPAIMLIRDPMRSIVSYWNWKKVSDRSQRHTASVNNDTLFSPEFRKFASREISTWERHYTNWISHLPNLLPVYYEYLRDDPVKHIRDMLSYMKIKTNEDRLGCVSSHLDGKLKGGQRVVDPYTLEQKSRLKRAVENVSTKLQDRGLPPLPRYDKYAN